MRPGTSMRRATGLAAAATLAAGVLAGCGSSSPRSSAGGTTPGASASTSGGESGPTPAVPTSSPAPPAAGSLANVVPEPVSVKPSATGFQITHGTTIWVQPGSAAARAVADGLAARLRPSTGYPLPVRDLPGAAALTGIDLLTSGASGEVGDEGYQLEVGTQSVVLRAGTAEGLFNGVQTLRQVLPAAAESDSPQPGPWVVPGGSVFDYPRYTYRGAMLDVARHFFTVGQVERYIDEISLYKINYLHLHLTDDQGWRIAINSWPRLAEVGGDSSVGDDQTGFYTQQQYEQIVAYAAAHYVTIVPEIDMPAHTNAAISAYGQLACDGQASQPYYGEEVGFIALCTSSQQTYAFVKDVLTEMAQLTPGPYLHIGGDEAHTLNAAQYSNFFDQTQPIVRALGKKAIGWDAITQSTMQPSTVIEWWDNTQTYAPDVVAATQHGSKIIMAPSTNAYLDQKYTPQTQLGLSWAGYIEVADAYNWDPTTVLSGVPASSVLGVEAPLWTETLRTTSDLEYMAFPRLPAIAEIGWSPQASHSWSSFQNRLAAQGPIWVALGMNFYRSPQIPWPAAAR